METASSGSLLSAGLTITGKSFGIRAIAYVIDLVALFLLNTVSGFFGGLAVGIILVLARLVLGQTYTFDGRALNNFNFVLGIVFLIIYFTIFEGLYGASLGKLILGLRVVSVDGQPCTLKAAFKRALWRLIDGLFFGLIGWNSMSKTPLRQRYGDKSAKTVVVGWKDPLIKAPRSWVMFAIGVGLYLLIAAFIWSASVLLILK